jgi:hypothetical protein
MCANADLPAEAVGLGVGVVCATERVGVGVAGATVRVGVARGDAERVGVGVAGATVRVGVAIGAAEADVTAGMVDADATSDAAAGVEPAAEGVTVGAAGAHPATARATASEIVRRARMPVTGPPCPARW